MAGNLTKKTFATPIRILSEAEDAIAAKGICPYCDKALREVVEDGVTMKVCAHCSFLFWIGEVESG